MLSCQGTGRQNRKDLQDRGGRMLSPSPTPLPYREPRMVMTSQSWVGRELAGGRYRVAALLGEGGMGCVYKAHDANLDCGVVIKVPRAAMLADPEFVGRFAREVRSL